MFLVACRGDETITGYAPLGQDFELAEINGNAVNFQATLRFDAHGKITGRAPCNSFTTQSTVPYPWFKVGPIAATRRACAQLNQEQRYFRALETMSLAETSGLLLILSNEAGDTLMYQLRD